ncbi:MAG: hypothetical protein QUS11_06525 [Candidatus Fermentibacter sp.]|nr:hypothetical protein [Candidatus Fermentibacter sp.]
MNTAQLLRSYRALPPPLRYGLPAAGAALVLLAGGSAAASQDPELDENAVAGPAFPWLLAWSPADRQILVDVSRRLNLDPRSLTSVFQLESRGDPAAPAQQSGTPRGGLIQITVGARLPGLDTSEKVWAVRGWPVSRQLLEIVEPFFARYKGRDLSWDEFRLYKLNFLPGVAGRDDGFVIGRRGSDEPLIPGQKLTLGAVYAANPGFDPGGARGYFTWGDVRKKIQAARRAGGDNVVTVGGRVMPDPQAGQRRIPPRRRAPGSLHPVPPWIAASEEMGTRPRLEGWS